MSGAAFTRQQQSWVGLDRACVVSKARVLYLATLADICRPPSQTQGWPRGVQSFMYILTKCTSYMPFAFAQTPPPPELLSVPFLTMEVFWYIRYYNKACLLLSYVFLAACKAGHDT